MFTVLLRIRWWGGEIWTKPKSRLIMCCYTIKMCRGKHPRCKDKIAIDRLAERTHTHTHTQARAHTHTHVHTHAHVHTHTYTHPMLASASHLCLHVAVVLVDSAVKELVLRLTVVWASPLTYVRRLATCCSFVSNTVTLEASLRAPSVPAAGYSWDPGGCHIDTEADVLVGVIGCRTIRTMFFRETIVFMHIPFHRAYIGHTDTLWRCPVRSLFHLE